MQNSIRSLLEEMFIQLMNEAKIYMYMRMYVAYFDLRDLHSIQSNRILYTDDEIAYNCESYAFGSSSLDSLISSNKWQWMLLNNMIIGFFCLCKMF